jgi:hypothetical protein
MAHGLFASSTDKAAATEVPTCPAPKIKIFIEIPCVVPLIIADVAT